MHNRGAGHEASTIKLADPVLDPNKKTLPLKQGFMFSVVIGLYGKMPRKA